MEISYKSIPDMLRRNASRFQGHLALKYRKQGKFVTLSYAEFYERALMAARGLKKLKSCLAIGLPYCRRTGPAGSLPIWGFFGRRLTVPIYPTNTPEQIEYMLNHSGAKIVFVSGKFQYEKLLKVRGAIPSVELVVSFEAVSG